MEDLKFKVKDKRHSELIQRVLFKLGYSWINNKRASEYLNYKYLLCYIGKNKNHISYCDFKRTFKGNENKEAYLEEFDNYVILYTKDNSVLKEFTKEEIGFKEENMKTKLTLETAKEMYNSGVESIKRFALDNYTEEELTKKERIKSWDEYKKSPYTELFYAKSSIADLGIMECAIVAMRRLYLLMAHEDYNGDWVPNWEDNKVKYVMYFCKDRIKKTNFVNVQEFLAFKDEETRDAFLENFRDLIIKAKPLL